MLSKRNTNITPKLILTLVKYMLPEVFLIITITLSHCTNLINVAVPHH